MDLIKTFIPTSIKHGIKKYMSKLAPLNTTFSQCGEDRILNYIFAGKKDGLYVDIGAFHPINCSNTYLFYEKGWHGINLDARPGSMKEFNRLRPRDINLELAIADSEELLTYYQMSEEKNLNLMNSFSIDFIRQIGMENSIVKQTEIKTSKLSKVLNEYLPKSTVIDFMSIDVEGMEIEVLKSNNWEVYRPRVLLVESIAKNISNLSGLNVVEFMANNEYQCFAKTPNGIFFVDKFVQISQINQIK